MSVLGYLPLVVAAVAGAVVLLSPFVTRVDRALTRLSLGLFRNFVERWDWKREERIKLLQATHATTTYSVYATKTVLFSIVGGVVTFVGTSYAGYAVISTLIAHKEAVKSSLPGQLHFVIETKPDSFGSIFGLGGGGPIQLGIPGWIMDLLPPWVISTAAGVWSAFPDSIRSWIGFRAGSPGTGTSVGEVEILIVFPDIGFIPDSLAMLSTGQLALLFGGAVWLGLLGGATVYSLRWYNLSRKARERRILIDESFVRTVAFVYALSRSGMLFPEIMRSVARNRKAFGETAEEFNVAVKQMDIFGADVITALEQTAEWTPSEQFADFVKNFTTVLKSGKEIPDYLHGQYEEAQRERGENQEQLLEFFTALGEAYVAVLVAGPLFLVAILTIFGLLFGGQYTLLQFMVYFAIPAGNLGFIAYLGRIGQTLTSVQVPVTNENDQSPIDTSQAPDLETSPDPVADGGVAAVEENVRRLKIYDRLRPIRWALEYPVETLTSKPIVVLYLVAPIALASVAIRWHFHGAGTVPPETLDDWLIQATLLVAGSFAVVREIHNRRLKRIEKLVPDFLESLASTNEAGRSFTESLKRIGTEDFGILGVEFRRLLQDLEWGARTEDALIRFSDRIGSPTVARVVALLTNALRSSDQIGPVIRIAADEARKDRTLKRKRRQEMLMYVLIVYISFVVFIGITIALKTVLVPAVPSAEQLGSLGTGGSFGINVIVDPAVEEMKDKYTMLLFHATAVQAVVSGLVAGKMGEGSVKNGAKHVTIMLGGAYVLFHFLG